VDLVTGSVPEAIADTVAKRAVDLLVVGMPRRRGVVATVIGSTAELLVPGVACDVLIVPAAMATQR
jgi:nucleotide-binding universal stress UspA family protein